MTADDREARLTAYALNDPGLSATDRREVEALIAAAPAARRALAETRQLAKLLTDGLAAEQAALPVEPAVVIPAPERTMRTHTRWAKPFVAAAAVLIAVGGSYLAYTKWDQSRTREDRQLAANAPAAEERLARDIPYGDRGAAQAGATATTAASATTGASRLQSELDQNRSEKDALKGDAAAKPDPAAPHFGPAAAPAPSPTAPAKKFAPPGRFGGEGSGGPGGAVGGRPGTAGPAAGPGAPPGGGAPGGYAPGPGQGGGLRPGMPRGPVPGADLPPGVPPPAGLPTPLPPAERAPARPGDPRPEPSTGEPRRDPSTEGAAIPNDRHPAFIENSFTRVEGINALSTFGVDVDTASYSIVRKYLAHGQLPPADAVRLEEMVNYFPYADKPPEGDDPFAATVEVADCPWEPAHRLARIGLKARPIAPDKRPPSNLVFLIDVSGSMNAPERLPLVKAGLKLLVAQLGDKDRVAMVVYAGTTGVVLDSTPATQKDKIVEALDRLEAGGSTNGSGGIQQAYEVAAAHFIKNGTNRVILCTDGDWNVGTTTTDALVKLIEEKKKTGVFLSAFGFGMGNLRDEMLVKLADKGDGNYAYIDSLKEAHKAFVEQISGTLVTVAKDVKVQVEFNPAVIKSYRLLGYEKRALAAKDFHDDTKDAGEMGAGHTVTALYELVPVGAPDPVVGKVDNLRYQKDPDAKPTTKIKPDEAFIVKMRHKKPDSDTSTLRELVVKDKTVDYAKASEDFQFAAAVASFAMLLKDSPYKGHSNYGLVQELASAATKHDPSGYRAEFVELVKKAKALAGK